MLARWLKGLGGGVDVLFVSLSVPVCVCLGGSQHSALPPAAEDIS